MGGVIIVAAPDKSQPYLVHLYTRKKTNEELGGPGTVEDASRGLREWHVSGGGAPEIRTDGDPVGQRPRVAGGGWRRPPPGRTLSHLIPPRIECD